MRGPRFGEERKVGDESLSRGVVEDELSSLSFFSSEEERKAEERVLVRENRRLMMIGCC